MFSASVCITLSYPFVAIIRLFVTPFIQLPVTFKVLLLLAVVVTTLSINKILSSLLLTISILSFFNLLVFSLFLFIVNSNVPHS